MCVNPLHRALIWIIDRILDRWYHPTPEQQAWVQWSRERDRELADLVARVDERLRQEALDCE